MEEDSSNSKREGEGTMVRRSIIGRSFGYLPSEQKDEERARGFLDRLKADRGMLLLLVSRGPA